MDISKSQLKAQELWKKAEHCLKKNKPERAYPLLLKMSELMPNDPAIIQNLGACALEIRRYDRAIESFEMLSRITPHISIEAACMHASAYRLGGRETDALNLLEKICESTQEAAPSIMYAGMLMDLKRFSEAAEILSPIVNTPGVDLKTVELYADVLVAQEHHLAAAKHLETIITSNPDNAEVIQKRAYTLLMVGEVEAAIEEYKKIEKADDVGGLYHSNLIFIHHYFDKLDNEDWLRLHDSWIEKYCPIGNDFKRPSKGNKIRGTLRVGYISGDFCLHAVSNFFEPVLEAHDRSKVSVYCYANNENKDWMTERLITLADKWRNIWDKNDTEVVRIIRNDSLDILVDLSGHTAGNRLSAISRRLAPVQISWLGYPSPTQIPSIDYIICDEVVFPNQVSKLPHGSEKPLIIEGGFHCYRQHAVAKIRQEPPCLKRGYVTFGSFNALAKISSSSFDLWSRVLKAVPNSKLLLKRTPLAEEKLRNKIIRKFADLDIESDRIEFRWDLLSTANHLEQYGEIDIALDTTPYNGTTTTCDALFMGVPVITLLGNQMVSRKSASILHQAELNNLIATNDDEYISISRDLSTDLRYLSELRKNIPETLKASRLCDASRMATALEDAYFKVTQFAE